MRAALTLTLLGTVLIPFALGCGGGGTTSPAPPSSSTLTAFFTSSWGDYTVRRTDAIHQMTDGTTAIPATIAGPATMLGYPTTDSLYADATNERLYVTGDTPAAGAGVIFVFDDALTAQGNIPPDRMIQPSPTLEDITGVELDEANDRLYVFGEVFPNAVLMVFDDASTLDGVTAPDETIVVGTGFGFAWLHLDTTNDHLYVAAGGNAPNNRVFVYENASTLTGAAAPSRAIDFGLINFHGVWVHGTQDRMYVAGRNASTAGNNVFVFNGASALDGAVDPDAASVARFPFAVAISLVVDDLDNLYVLGDSATSVSIYAGASTLTGDVTTAPRVIHGTVDRGYGLDALHYPGP
jgi:hypothetical protein